MWKQMGENGKVRKAVIVQAMINKAKGRKNIRMKWVMECFCKRNGTV